MKRITFFNEKGGTGKTLFNMLFSSWLAYEKGERVLVQDFDFPSYHFFKTRQMELQLMASDPAFAKLVVDKPYPLGKVSGKEAFTREELMGIIDQVRTQSQGEGYYIMDFPGRFLANDPVHALAMAGLIDNFIFPVDADRQSWSSALFVNSVLNNPKVLARSGKTHQDTLVLWNRETRQERAGNHDFYSMVNDTFRAVGIPVCSTRCREILSMRRDGDTFGFFRSTVCYPKVNISRTAPWLGSIFEEIYQRINGTWDEDAMRVTTVTK